MKKKKKLLKHYFFFFSHNFFLNELLTNILRTFVSIFHKYNVRSFRNYYNEVIGIFFLGGGGGKMRQLDRANKREINEAKTVLQ